MAKAIKSTDDEAARLKQARIRRGLGGPKETCRYFHWVYDTYIQHERGERGLRKPVAEKYAKAFRVSTAWLLTGEGDPGWGEPAKSHDPGIQADDTISVSRDVLKQALLFVLRNEGVPDQRASLIADILPEALSGPLVDVVESDPYLSFRVHFQMEAKRSGYSG